MTIMSETRVLFIGSKRIGLTVMSEMLRLHRSSVIGALTIDDQTDPRSVFASICELARLNNVPICVAANRSESEKFILASKPDLCIVAGWYWIISSKTLE